MSFRRDQETEPHIVIRSVGKTFDAAGQPFQALKSVSLDIDPGEFVTVIGASGSGKSTLLNLLAGIDQVTEGEIHVAGAAVHRMGEQALSIWRGRNVGIVFQFFQLMPTLTCLENVLLAMDFQQAIAGRDRRTRAAALLERMGVADQAGKFPATLSGGQQQRVAIARALANDPPLVVADEPTGNLDSKTSEQVIELFTTLAAEGKTVVMVTHERDAARFADRTVTLVDGQVAPGTETSEDAQIEEAAHV